MVGVPSREHQLKRSSAMLWLNGIQLQRHCLEGAWWDLRLERHLVTNFKTDAVADSLLENDQACIDRAHHNAQNKHGG